MRRINTIIWDWNGTLLDDIDICLNVINILLGKRNRKPLSRERYKSIFTFPVHEYYKKAGFDFSDEPFDKIATEFIQLYHKEINNADIFPEVVSSLEAFKNNNYRQFMVSAMEHKSLMKTVEDKGLFEYFEKISGIEDHYAVSKLQNARKLVTGLNLDLSKTCLIGDTIHDYEVASDLGIRCLLIANGHQSYSRLKNSGCNVIEKLSNAFETILTKIC